MTTIDFGLPTIDVTDALKTSIFFLTFAYVGLSSAVEKNYVSPPTNSRPPKIVGSRSRVELVAPLAANRKDTLYGKIKFVQTAAAKHRKHLKRETHVKHE